MSEIRQCLLKKNTFDAILQFIFHLDSKTFARRPLKQNSARFISSDVYKRGMSSLRRNVPNKPMSNITQSYKWWNKLASWLLPHLCDPSSYIDVWVSMTTLIAQSCLYSAVLSKGIARQMNRPVCIYVYIWKNNTTNEQSNICIYLEE